MVTKRDSTLCCRSGMGGVFARGVAANLTPRSLVSPLCVLSAGLFQRPPHLRVHRTTHLSHKGRELGGLFGTSKRLRNVILSRLCTHLHGGWGVDGVPHVHAPYPRGPSSVTVGERTLSMCRPTGQTRALRRPPPPFPL